MSRVNRRPLAEADVFEIWDYIADDSFEAADRWVDQLDEKLHLLATKPLMGRARDELERGVRGLAQDFQLTPAHHFVDLTASKDVQRSIRTASQFGEAVICQALCELGDLPLRHVGGQNERQPAPLPGGYGQALDSACLDVRIVALHR
jgi:plasmid stabilization system protein ParE